MRDALGRRQVGRSGVPVRQVGDLVFPPLSLAAPPLLALHPGQRAVGARRLGGLRAPGWPNRYGGMARKVPEPAMCNKRDEYEMVLPRKRRECGSGDADGRRHCHTLCTHGVRASVVMLQGEPVSEQTSGGRPRGAGGTADELCMEGQQPACDRRPQPRSQRLGAPTRSPMELQPSAKCQPNREACRR